MITAIIIDDEKKSREVLIRLLEELTRKIDVIGEAGSVEDGFKVINHLKPNLVFLDIEMLDGTGFNLLEKFTDIRFEVVFTTAYDQYAIKAFKYSALDYLLKPINIDELEDVVKKVEDNLKKNRDNSSLFANLLANINQVATSKRIAIRGANTIDYITIKDIVFCASDISSTVFFLCDGRKIMATKPLKNYEELLEEELFFRISKFHLINVNHVLSYQKEKSIVKMVDNTEIEVARRKRKEFIEFMDKRLMN